MEVEIDYPETVKSLYRECGGPNGLAESIGCHPSTIRRIESGEVDATDSQCRTRIHHLASHLETRKYKPDSTGWRKLEIPPGGYKTAHNYVLDIGETGYNSRIEAIVQWQDAYLESARRVLDSAQDYELIALGIKYHLEDLKSDFEMADNEREKYTKMHSFVDWDDLIVPDFKETVRIATNDSVVAIVDEMVIMGREFHE
ncbi:hypothetical protein [Haladaptatus sp. DYSN1]|uniref:hypothetical protein n=1 Tax=unclassified Haladaptatus TaxID=2622732 RepID=UPI00240504B8|nr:hypothetical protein [Haladaptatus sp. DYSN1]